MAPEDLTITSTIELADGRHMPRFGFGVYEAEGDDCYQSVKWALEAGYRLIDTAEWYENEEETGRAVVDFMKASGVKREEIFYTTKLMANRTYDHCLQRLKHSLDISGLGYLDLYLIHGPQPSRKARQDTWRACQEAVKRGWVRSIGVSNFGNHHIDEIEAVGGGIPCTVNQIDLHPFMRRKDLVANQTARKIVMEAWGPLARGMRMDHPVITKVAKKHSKTPAQIFIRWGLQQNFVVIPKSVKKDRVVANAQVFGWSLDADDLKDLDGLDEHLVTDWDPSDEPHLAPDEQ